MPTKTFRNTSVALAVMIVIVGYASTSHLDDAGWDERLVAFSVAVAPWLISATVVWVGGEIINEMRRGKAE